MPQHQGGKQVDLSEKTVAQLRKMAKREGVKQVTQSGEHRNKSQLVAAIRRAQTK